MGYTIDSFLKVMKPYAIRDMKSTGILASLTIAQAKVESGTGNSKLTVECNNLFGIKGTYNGQGKQYWTWEYENGVKVRRYCYFRKYPSWQESLNDHSGLFNRASRYKNLRNCQDYAQACINVRKDKYCTAPEQEYIGTLTNFIKKHKLWLIDYEVIKDYPASKLNTVKQGSKGAGVYLLQMTLVDKGFKIKVDADFGNKTLEAVKAYQQQNHLTDDGIVGQKTWGKLRG